tara:strand:- start:83 stop:1456 length:1374 start_codon:yes stop_codon:yes gene_type:complete
MRILFQNHSSLLLELDGNYLLTDPWYNQPAFGSWLPSFAPYVHPSYLAALGDKLTVLISHGHDDHFDDRLLSTFDKKTKFITADFKAPSVINRVKRLGFGDITTIGEKEVNIGKFTVSSYVVEDFSHDDAAYMIRTNTGAVIHANDNWNEFTINHKDIINKRISNYDKDSVLLFSQTNSASGYPLNYKNFSDSEKQSILKSKVAKMVQGGLKNAESLGLNKIFSYAGYATSYVKDKNYHKEGLFPTAKFLKDLLKSESIETNIDIIDLYPGDYINLPKGDISKAFVNGYTDQNIKMTTDTFYHVYGNIDECISYSNLSMSNDYLSEWTDNFLKEFNTFVQRRVDGPDSHYTELLGKTFSIEININDTNILQKTIEFGSGLRKFDPKANKICFVSAPTFFAVLKGDALFEDLYTGYNAEWSRNPSDIYNRDIIMMIVMFSYVYKYRFSKKFSEQYNQL